MTSVAVITSAILAHQGGWDEILMVAGPVLLLWLILRMANKRAHRMLDATTADNPLADTPEETAIEGLSPRGEPSPRDR